MRLGIIHIGDPVRIVAAGAVSNVVTISFHITERIQADNAMTRKFEGAGLGLPLYQGAMIRQHGGDLSIVGELGVGTTVSVTFPAERVL